jgi:hypothetical protein
LYIAIVNGAILGFLAGVSSNRVFEHRGIVTRFFHIGLVAGMLMGLLWIDNQISIEFHLNRGRLEVPNPYLGYFRYYGIGLALGVLKAFYYAVVPSVVFFTVMAVLIKRMASLLRG